MKRLKKILFILPNGIGGAQRMTITYAKMLSSEKFEVKFIVLKDLSQDELVYFQIPNKFDVLEINTFLPKRATSIPFISSFQKVEHYLKYFYSVPKLREVIRNEEPYAIFCSLAYYNIMTLLASHKLSVKKIIRLNNYLSIEKPIVQYLIKKVYPFADVIIAQQRYMADDYILNIPHIDNKIIVVNNPVDTEQILSKAKAKNPYPKNNKNIFLWAGNISPKKGQDIAILAFALVHEQMPESHLYFIGKIHRGEFEKKCYALAREKNLINFVHFEGMQDNPYVWMQYCDCFVMPSRLEGLPNAVVEAMILKKPVAVTECIPFMKDMVIDGVNGYVCPTESPEKLAEAMINAINLKDIKMRYRPANEQDIEKLF